MSSREPMPERLGPGLGPIHWVQGSGAVWQAVQLSSASRSSPP